jgi:GAF domain-containing protein
MTDTSRQPVGGPPVSEPEARGSSTKEAPPASAVVGSTDPSEPAGTLHVLMTTVAAADPRFRHVSVVHPRTAPDMPVVATTPLARAMAEAQLAANDGGMAEAIRTGLPVIVTGSDRATRFPAVQAVSRRLGVDLQLAVPLVHRTRVVGAFSLYALDDADAAVDLSLLELAQALAGQAAALLELARTAADLRTAMVTRQRIGQACGILMSRFVLTDAQAFSALTRASQHRNLKIRELAQEVITTGTLPELEHGC